MHYKTLKIPLLKQVLICTAQSVCEAASHFDLVVVGGRKLVFMESSI